MLKQQILSETSKIPWHELQRFFASGLVLVTGSEVDLVEVAYQISNDNKDQVERWLNEKKVTQVSDQQALKWFEEKAMVWAVVVKPWILVQETRDEQSGYK